MRKLIPLLLLPCFALADDFRNRLPNPTSVIEESMCIPELNGEGCLHVDEDVAGLIIQVYGADGVLVALYDADTEIEDIAVIGTYAAPTASNVRVSPQAASGADLTQMMFADAVYDSQPQVTICVSDGQTTIMDFCRFVDTDFLSQAAFEAVLAGSYTTEQLVKQGYLDDRSLLAAEYATAATQTSHSNQLTAVPTEVWDLAAASAGEEVDSIGALVNSLDGKADTAQAGLNILQRGLTQVDTTIDTLASQESFTLTAGSADDNAYNRCTAMITDQATAEQIAMGDIMDYTGSTKTVLLRFDPGIFTMATGDLVTITCLGR